MRRVVSQGGKVNMKWSPVLHSASIVTAALGGLSLLGAWIASVSQSNTFIGRSETHLFNDATVLILLSISFALGVLIHRDQERGS